MSQTKVSRSSFLHPKKYSRLAMGKDLQSMMTKSVGCRGVVAAEKVLIARIVIRVRVNEKKQPMRGQEGKLRKGNNAHGWVTVSKQKN